MKETISDEMLMGYVDGELEEHDAARVRHALAGDPALATAAAEFGRSRETVRAAYEQVRTQPVPERLVATVLGRRTADQVVVSLRRRAFQVALPLAASLALAVGVAGYWIGQQQPMSADGTETQRMAAALAATRNGETRSIRIGSEAAELRTLASYEVEGGFCRTFSVAREGGQPLLRGVGCRRPDQWTVELTVAGHDAANGYSPASDPGSQSIDAFLDAMEARPVDEHQ